MTIDQITSFILQSDAAGEAARLVGDDAEAARQFRLCEAAEGLLIELAPPRAIAELVDVVMERVVERVQ